MRNYIYMRVLFGFKLIRNLHLGFDIILFLVRQTKLTNRSFILCSCICILKFKVCDTKIFPPLCERTFKTVMQVLFRLLCYEIIQFYFFLSTQDVS